MDEEIRHLSAVPAGWPSNPAAQLPARPDGAAHRSPGGLASLAICPDGTAHWPSSVACPNGTTHRTSPAARPNGTTHRTSSVACPDGTAHRPSPAARPNGTTHWPSSAACPNGTAHRTSGGHCWLPLSLRLNPHAFSLRMRLLLQPPPLPQRLLPLEIDSPLRIVAVLLPHRLRQIAKFDFRDSHAAAGRGVRNQKPVGIGPLHPDIAVGFAVERSER
jgi:hypothetical protein